MTRALISLRLGLAVVIAALAVTVMSVAATAGPAGAQTAPTPTTAPSSGGGSSCIIASCSTVAQGVECTIMPSACVAQAVVGGVSSQVADAVSSMAEAFMAVLVKGVAAGAKAMFDEVGKFMTGATTPNVSAADFVSGDGPYHKVAAVSAALMVVFLLASVIQGTLSGEPGQMLMRFVRSAPMAVLAIVVFPILVDLAVQSVDAICSWLLPTGETMDTIAKVFTVDQIQSAVGFGLPLLLCELFAFLGSVLIFAELVVRNALVLVAVALAPLSFAAMVWTAARSAARKVAELLAGIILSKLAIWVALLVGIQLFAKQASSQSGAAYGQMIAGSAVLAVAIFAPFVVWRMLPLAEGAVIAHGLSRMPARAAQQGMYTANSARSMAGRHGGGGGGQSSSGQSQPGPMQNQSLGNGGGGSSSGGPSGPPGANGATGAAGAKGATGSPGAGSSAAGGGAAGGAAGGGAAGGGAAAGGAAAGAGAAAAPVAVPLAAAKAGKDKAAGSADSQSSNGGGGSGWGFAP